MESRPLRIAALIKQIPKFEAMELGADGRLVREGLKLEMNPYCRRAVGKGTELAAATGGHLTVITLGPPPAEDSLRESLAWADQHGASADAVLITDPAFAGSDTLATARALAAALERLGPFDLILAGRNSVDADTGQVGPELAELLDLPILAGVKELEITGDEILAGCEYDDGWVQASTRLPAVLSCAERLCSPSKVDQEGRDAVAPDRIAVLTAADLGAGPWGQAGSPTSVGAVRIHEVHRERRVLDGPVAAQVEQAVALLEERGALTSSGGAAAEGAPEATAGRPAAGRSSRVPDTDDRLGGLVAVLVEPGRERLTRELLGAAARLAAELGGRVAAIGPGDHDLDPATAGSFGADDLLVLDGSNVEEDIAAGVAAWAAERVPWAILAPSTVWGREVSSRVAARLGAGLTGDAVDLDIDGGRLVAWKPAFGGALVAAITASSPVQMATVRAGVLPVLEPRDRVATSSRLDLPARRRVQVHERRRDDDVDVLATAEVVIGVGRAVEPSEYDEIEPLRLLLGAELGATRKVTDEGWMPRARQIGITGRSIAPRLFVSIGASGKFNHVVGVRGAHTVLAINADPEALVFSASDIGIVGDWHEVVSALTRALSERSAAAPA